MQTIFLTVPDLLDWLRYSYDSSDTTFEQRFEEIRNVRLLVLDDLGTQNATAWAQAGREIPCLGTTHADYFPGPVPVTEPMTAAEIRAQLGAG